MGFTKNPSKRNSNTMSFYFGCCRLTNGIFLSLRIKWTRY
jgi:hypothetical protein